MAYIPCPENTVAPHLENTKCEFAEEKAKDTERLVLKREAFFIGVKTEEWCWFTPGVRMYEGNMTLFYNGENLHVMTGVADVIVP